jgi:branched-chain amino acid transport system substrate-binding protein
MGDEPQVSPEPDAGSEKSGITRKKFIGGVAGAGIGLGLAGILAACGGGGGGTSAAATTAEAAATTSAGQTTANNAKPILIGSPYPTTNSPEDAEQMERGSGLAIGEINDAGGVAGRKIDHYITDMNSFDAQSLTTAFNDVVSKEPDAIIIGYQNVFKGIIDIPAAYGAPFLNASTSIEQVTLLKADPVKFASNFQADPTEVPYGTGFPPFLDNLIAAGKFKPPEKKIYIIEGDITYGQTISKACQDAAPKLGWDIVGVDPVDTQGGSAPVADWTPFINKVKSTGATVTFNTHWNPADHAAFMKKWAADPPDSFVYLQYGASLPQFLQLAGDAAKGVVWATVLGTMNDPVGLAFQKAYQAKWNAPAGFSNAGTGYDEVYLLAHAWGITGDPRNFKANIAELKRNIMRGVSGGYWFGSDVANYCLSYPAEIADPSLGNPHLFFQVLPDSSGKLSHQVIQPPPYVNTEYVQQPWLSF